MRKIILPLCAIITWSCSDDDRNSGSSTTVEILTSTVRSGSWEITTFSKDGTDHTADFADYVFTFASSGLLTAVKGEINHTGAWSVTTDDSDDDDPDDIDFNIAFASPPGFEELTEDWRLLEVTDSKIRMRHKSGGDGSTDLLTIEKN